MLGGRGQCEGVCEALANNTGLEGFIANAYTHLRPGAAVNPHLLLRVPLVWEGQW